jgi:hypothetical protein
MATCRWQGSVPAKCCHTFAAVVCIGVGLLVNYLYCGLDYILTDISEFDLALLFHLIIISLLFILMSFTALFMLFVLVVSENKLSLIQLLQAL